MIGNLFLDLPTIEETRAKYREVKLLFDSRNPGASAKLKKAWHKAHPEKRSLYTARRRARQRAAPLNDFTDAQWQAMKIAFKSCCAYCGRKTKALEPDHLTPLSKGGSHTLSNIVPACRVCNAHKCAGPPPVPVQPVLLLSLI